MNTFPTVTPTRRIAIVYETAPGASEYLADSLLASSGIDREACFIGTVSPRPGLKFDSPEVQASVSELETDLLNYKPHFVLILDRFGLALRVFSGEKKSVDNWRGSLFMSNFAGPVKCLCTYHPSRLQVEYGLTGVARFDFARAARECATDALDVPKDFIGIEIYSIQPLLDVLNAIVRDSKTVAVDIEGYPSGISCIGFATGPNTAFVIPFIKHDNTSYWSEEDELALWLAVQRVLEAPNVIKICHNALYELFCLAWAYGIVIRGLEHDTMVMHFELYAEMEKSLGFCTSIYTKHPFYKSERKSTDDRALLLYNGKDCCRTYEIWQVMTPKLQAKQREHYEFNMSLLVPLAYMSLRGIKYDKAAAERRLAEVQQQIYEKQDEINREASANRPELAAFYDALLELPTTKMDDPKSTEDNKMVSKNGQSDSEHKTKSFNKLIPIFARAFCKARCTESREVEETTWQPMRWNGKKWVKEGKRYPSLTAFGEAGGTNFMPEAIKPPESYKDYTWLKPITKLVLRNVPVEIRTFEDVQRFAKDSCSSCCKRAIAIVANTRDSLRNITNGESGELATLLDLHIKINATQEGGDAQWYLYEHCKLPPQYQKDGNKLTTRLASDDEAVIKAWVQSKDPRALTFLALRKLITSKKYLTASPDEDGRLRFGLNLVATPTGRMAGYGSPTGSSDINPQTIGKSIRDLFPADSADHMIGQFDLDGSDSWSVAAYAASLGDPTMLDDNLARLKPAKILACIYEQGPDINKLDRSQLKTECKKVDGEGWLYFACKRVLHGSNYGMGKITMANQILTDSYKLLGKPVHLDGATCERIQKQAFFVRYPGVLRWHQWMTRELTEKGILIACNGFQRKFYGRKTENSTLKEALAHMPQVLTTYGITSTLLKLWNSETNRNEDGSFKVEALLCVHDSLVLHWHKQHLEYAQANIKTWFKQEMNINNVAFHIPVNGTAGPNWLHQGGEKWADYGGIDMP